MATGRVLQKREAGYVPRNERTQSLPLAIPRQNIDLHGQVSSGFLASKRITYLLNALIQVDFGALLRHEVRIVSARHANLLHANRKP